MNPRPIILLALALSAAGMTAYFANSWMASQRAALEDQAPTAQAAILETVDVLVAKSDMPIGSFIRADVLEWRAWPKDGVVDDYLVRGEATEEELAGAVARSKLFAGEPITRSRVVTRATRASSPPCSTPAAGPSRSRSTPSAASPASSSPATGSTCS
jgi:pilus assembly protein CpaB